MSDAAALAFVLSLSGAELRSRLVNRGWPEQDAERLVECHRAGCAECTETLCEVVA